MKKRYVFPQMEVINLNHQAAILVGSTNDHVDSKRNLWDDSPEEWDEQQASKSNNTWEQ
jgi:hypothetical protein